MKKIAVVTGTRAEYGLLKPVIKHICEDNSLKLCLIVTGMHLSEKYGSTYKEIECDGFKIDYKVNMNLDDNSAYGITCAMSREMIGMADVFAEERPDMLVLLGDRYETYVAAITAMMFEIPITHIHGGELTEGAVDDSIRHAITKMSMLHFTSTEDYSRRVIQMGEAPERVFNVGALGVENIENIKLYTRAELCDIYKTNIFSDKYLMITYHPVTHESGLARKQFSDLLMALSELKDYKLIFTYANADVEGKVINEMIEKYIEDNPDKACAYVSMGQKGYLSALKYCSAVIGNSSSGIIEAPSFNIPTINIGHRQDGRVKADTVIDCENDKESISFTIKKALSSTNCKSSINPYKGKNTSENIVNIIKKYMSGGRNCKKTFYDII